MAAIAPSPLKALAAAIGALAVVVAAAAGAAAASPLRASVVCPPSVHRFVASLAEIDGQLDVGINFREYESLRRRAHAAYARVPVKRLPHSCLVRVAVPAEKALNAYTVASNIWRRCIGNLNCNRAADARLRFRWQQAGNYLETAVNNLDE